MAVKPLAIDLFCGLGGWTEGLLAEGYDVIGFDIEVRPYPAQLVIQDVLTLHGSQFKDAALIVASPPCQFFSYVAMPWSRAKAIAKEVRQDSARLETEKALFNACFRIQREASEAAGRHIPMVVENVRGAQSWVGKAKANYGSFYLWGDVGMVGSRVVGMRPKFGEGVAADSRRMKSRISCAARRFDERIASTPEEAHALHYRMPDAVKVAGFRFDGNGSLKTAAVRQISPARRAKHFEDTEKHALKGPEGGWFNDLKRQGKGATGYLSQSGSKSSARKQASAAIAKIPFALSQHIARVYKP